MNEFREGEQTAMEQKAWVKVVPSEANLSSVGVIITFWSYAARNSGRRSSATKYSTLYRCGGPIAGIDDQIIIKVPRLSIMLWARFSVRESSWLAHLKVR